jgi:hypothetical protein
MSYLMRYAAAVGTALTLAGSPVARAAEQADGPVKLADQELEQVTGGEGSLLDVPVNLKLLLKNITVTVNVSNVPINAGLVVQANALGSAAQTATVQALQEVTQIQQFPGFPAH